LLEKEQAILTAQQIELQNKRAEVEEEKHRLAEEKKYLDEQKAEKQRLLAESQRREEAYKKELAETTAMISQIDEMISDVVIQLFKLKSIRKWVKGKCWNSNRFSRAYRMCIWLTFTF
jgi:chromosome segregation ATPase